MVQYVTEFPLTFEEAFARFEIVSELYSHLDPVKLYYHKGEFILTYTKEYENESNEVCRENL